MTRIFSSCVEMYEEIKRTLWEMGITVKSYSYQDRIVKYSKEGWTKEIRGIDYKITDTSDKDEMIKHVGGNLEWCRKEFEERISGKPINPGNAWELRRETWEQFLKPVPGLKGERKFDYTYSERLYDKLDLAINELKQHPTSRQIFIPVYDWKIDCSGFGGKKRVPCSIGYGLLIRENKLDMFYVQRSCDFLKHFVYDVWLAAELQNWIAKKLKVKPGIFQHYIISLHAFYVDLEKLGIF